MSLVQASSVHILLIENAHYTMNILEPEYLLFIIYYLEDVVFYLLMNKFMWRAFFPVIFTIVLLYIDTDYHGNDRYKINPENRKIFQVKIRSNFS